MDLEICECQVQMTVDLRNEQEAKRIMGALLPETQAAPSERAKTTITTNGCTLFINVTAEDLTALRAATNSFLSWLDACTKISEAVTGQNP